MENSLMNPTFLQKELFDCIDLLAKTESFTLEMNEDFDIIFAYFNDVNLRDNTVTLPTDCIIDIMKVLNKVRLNHYRMTSPRQVVISQYKQLLKDRRYRIATKLARFFSK